MVKVAAAAARGERAEAKAIGQDREVKRDRGRGPERSIGRERGGD
jgi:hypothetical protein